MLKIVCEVLLGPLLVAVSTLAARRRGARIGGVISGFPAVVGPVLLIAAEQDGAASAAGAARGTLLGLVALAGFVVAYATAAQRVRWPAALVAGWMTAGTVSIVLALGVKKLDLPGDLAAAVISLALADRLLAAITPPKPSLKPDQRAEAAANDLPLRMAATAALVVVLSLAVQLVGPLIGGMLAALPVLASVLAVFTHRDHGPQAAVLLLRGMLVGMAGFISFCLVVALLAPSAGVGLAVTAATLAALGSQAVALDSRIRRAAAMLPGRGHAPSAPAPTTPEAAPR